MTRYTDNRRETALLIERLARQARQRAEWGEPTVESKNAYKLIYHFIRGELFIYIMYQAALSADQAELLVDDLLHSAWQHIHHQPAGQMFYYWIFERASVRMASRHIYRHPQASPAAQSRDNQAQSKKASSKPVLPRRPLSHLAQPDGSDLTISLLHLLPLRQCQCLLLFERLRFSIDEIATVLGIDKNAIIQALATGRVRFRSMYLQRARSPKRS